ncbi:MAG: hypothetical protein Q8Q73_14740 [Stagnimonas sp.]|nr:hypothetical protein [Stagnimonas sp.]
MASSRTLTLPAGRPLRFIQAMQRQLARARSNARVLAMLDAVPTYLRGQALERRRAMRADRLDACIVVLMHLAEWMSETSRIVDHRPDKGIIGRRLRDVAEASGLDDRRLDRAVRDLKAAGYLLSWERCDYDAATQEYRGVAAIRQISHKLIEHLGLSQLWEKCSKARVQREREKKGQQAAGAPTMAQMRQQLAVAANAVRSLRQLAAVHISATLPKNLAPPG